MTTNIPPEYLSRFSQYMQEAPIDVAECARAVGLPIFATPLPDGVSGMLVRKDPEAGDSGFACYVDATEPNVRQRFTAAHELGHFSLHKDKIGETLEDNYLLRADGLTSYQETQANAFAADLLMPRNLIERYMQDGIRDVKELAKKFGVSQVAMSIRLGLPT